MRADRQAANFVTIVPRDASLLPPAIELDETADRCIPRVSEAEVESELTTFLNQVEGHVGKPAILKLSPEFEERYQISARIDRNLWLMRDRFLMQEVWQYMGLPVEECLETALRCESLQIFQTLLFSKIVPNVKRLGLLTPRVRRGFEELGVLQFESWDASA